ncbi:MAG TPA: hypothetical protein VFZ73_15425, partial [Gemmatimonadaceae bacterium]
TIGLLACESTSSPAPVYERTVAPGMVTGAALAALRPDGRLNPESYATSLGELPLAEAKSEALGFARYVTNNGLLRGVVENERGGVWTDPHLLTICGDAWYVHSPFAAITHDSLGEPGISYLKRLGGQWLIPFCGSQQEPQMTVQAAVEGNSIRFADGEPVDPYSFLLSAWNARGVPLGWPDALPISAERAVRFAYETFGVRVSEVPQLYVRGDFQPDGSIVSLPPGWARSCNRWRLTLESDVKVRGSSSSRVDTTNVLYVAALTCHGSDVIPYIHLPLAAQPATTALNYVDNEVSPPKTWTVIIPFSTPVRFEVGFRAP